MGKVSILVPVYGVEKYIGKCAESLFSQTFQDIEYIFVNDCTPDHSIDLLQEILMRYPERKEQVKIIHHKCNMGLGAARQTALEKATGEYIMIVDSDDYIAVDAVEVLCRQIEKTGADVIDGAFVEFSDESTSAPFLPKGYSATTYLKLLLCHNIVFNMVWGRIFRRSLIVENNLSFPQGIDYSEDFSFLSRFMFHAKTRLCIDNVVYYYRRDNVNSYTRQISERSQKSNLLSYSLVYKYINERDANGTYYHALNMSMLQAQRSAREYKMPMKILYEKSNYSPSHWLYRIMKCCFDSRVPLPLCRFLQKIIRTIYAWWVIKFS